MGAKSFFLERIALHTIDEGKNVLVVVLVYTVPLLPYHYTQRCLKRYTLHPHMLIICSRLHFYQIITLFVPFFCAKACALDKLEAFTSFNGPDFYGLPRNTSKITLQKAPWKVPESFSFPFGDIVPMFAGETLEWQPCIN